jgi:iron complex outermembrane receptor protein
VTQERVLAYEAGFKQTLLDRKIDVTGAVFYYNYKDKQVLGSTYNAFGVGPALINIPKSYVAGAELNATVRPVSQLTLSGGVTYVKSRVQTNPGAPFAALTPFGVPTSFIGDPLPNTPAWMGNLDAVYTIPVRGERDVYFGASSATRSWAYAQFGDLSSFRIPGYTLVDLRAGLKTEDGKWRFELWDHNVANKTYWQNIYYGLDVLARSVGDPMTYGVSVSYRFQ